MQKHSLNAKTKPFLTKEEWEAVIIIIAYCLVIGGPLIVLGLLIVPRLPGV